MERRFSNLTAASSAKSDIIDVRKRNPHRRFGVLSQGMYYQTAECISRMGHPPDAKDGTYEGNPGPRLGPGCRVVVRPRSAGGPPRGEKSLPRPRRCVGPRLRCPKER